MLKNLMRRLLGTNPEPKTTDTLNDIIDKYQILEVVPGSEEHGPFVIVTEREALPGTTIGGINIAEPEVFNPFEHYSQPPIHSVVSGAASNMGREPVQLKETPTLGQLGGSSPTAYFNRREYNSKLAGTLGLETINKARLSDGIVAGTILAVKTPVYAGDWRVDPVSDKPKDKEISEFVWKVLTEYQSITWTQILIDSMLSVDFGCAIFEKVWDVRVIKGKERAVLKKLAPIHPFDIKEVKYDGNGGPESITFYVRKENLATNEVTIPIADLLVITINREVGDIQGRSILRPAYQHYYYKTQLYKIDAIQKERHGIGIPVIKLPPGFTTADSRDANELGRNLRTNERAHIVLPPNWELVFAKLEGQPVDAMKSIEYHDDAIRESVLAGFTGYKNNTKEEDLSTFLKSTRFIADSICDAFNLYLIPDIIKYNYDIDKTDVPKLKVRQIGEQADNRTMSFAIRNMVGAGIIRPDDRLENYVRQLLDLPPVDLETVRVVKTPQAGQAPPGALPNATPGTQTDPAKPQPAVPDGTGKENPNDNKPGLPRQTPLPNIGVGGSKVGDNRGQ